ncbi:uncharacterized protein ELE39_003030 [Cryptosporidium sp. chipmunk genotype I]|uniref:uncharacterized protein n=1 Tax=Cryptosporidium sp. chipmunk genotype I TaxID=1280935 RepID=UPI00351A47E9|nr:hypothetical protein ELE39_003030 [Cryptosporidium sp. chipmunk genotype I]
MSKKDISVHANNQMSSDVLRVRYRQELNSLSLEPESNQSFNRRSLAIWLFEWYDSKGRRLPYGKNEKRLNEIPEEELEFLHGILKELPGDFPMIRYSVLWSKWLLPNVKIDNSRKCFDYWLGIMKIMEERFSTVYVNDVDPLVKLVSDYLHSALPDEFELCYVGVKLLKKLVSMYIPPRKGFGIVTTRLLESFGSFYVKETFESAFVAQIKDEIAQLVQICVSDKHLPSFLSILKNEVLSVTGSPKQNLSTNHSFSLNYTFDFYKTLVGQGSRFDCFIPLIVKKIHEVERSVHRENQTSSIIGGDYLLFFLYLSLNLADQKEFHEKSKYVNECFNFFIEVNTFNIRESDDEFGNNFKLRIYELIFKKLQESISRATLNPVIWKTIENSIIIDPVKCLEFLSRIFLSGKADQLAIPKSGQLYYKNPIYGPLEIMLDFISGEDLSSNINDSILLNSESSASSSLAACISKYMLTFIKLHDLPLFFSSLSEVLLKNIKTKDLFKLEDIFLSTQVLQTIKDNIGVSILPSQTSDIFDSFLRFLNGNSSGSLLYESVSGSWIGVLMIAIPLSESSIPSLEHAARQIHQYIRNSDSNCSFTNNSKTIQITCTIGLIHLLRKLLSWNIEQNSEFIQMLNFHYDKILSQNYDGKCDQSYSHHPSLNVYNNLVYLITLITKLRDSGSLNRNDFNKVFVLYVLILDGCSSLVSNDPAWRIRVNRILTKFILQNISHLKSIEEYIKDYVESRNENEFPQFSSFMRSLYQEYIQTNYVPNSLFRSLVQIPYLTNLMIDMALEELDRLIETGRNKRRRLNSDQVSGEHDFFLYNDLQMIDFWNRRDLVTYFVNNRTEPILGDIFSKVSKLYLKLVLEFDYVSGSKRDKSSLLHSLKKAVEGIMRWINIESEIGTNDFIIRLSQAFFSSENGKKEPNSLAKLLALISKVETNTKLSQNLNLILRKLVKSASESEEESKKTGDLLLTQMESLDWWWWINITNNFEDILAENMSWVSQIQLCIDLCSENSFILTKEKIVGKVNIFQTLRDLKGKLKERKRMEMLYSAKICELYLEIDPEIQNWDLNTEETVGKFDETQENWSFPKIKSIIKILRRLLDGIRNVFEDSEKRKKLLNEGFILIDLSINYLKQVVQIINKTVSELKKNQENMKLCFGSLEKVYSDTFMLFLELIRINLEFGIYGTDQKDCYVLGFGDHYKTVSEWNRYVVKCILEGSSIRKEDYSHSSQIYRQMDIYEMVSRLVSGSVTSLLNYAINETMINVNFSREENLFVLLSHLDLFWGVIRNKGQIYRCLSPCLKGRLFSKIKSWGTSDKLEFSIEILISKLLDSIERRRSDIRNEYILCTFSFIRLSNIISILYSCCVGCYIEGVKENPRSSLNNSRIIHISNILLVISSRISSIGLVFRLDDLEEIMGKERMGEKTKELFYLALFECLTISPYIPLYTLLNPLWDQSNRKKNGNQSSRGHLDVWISQFHLIEEALKNLVNLGDQMSLHPVGLKLYTFHNKRISRLYPLVVSQITKNKVQRYSISLACDLINYINIINKRLENVEDDEDLREIINLNVQIIKNSCLNPILSVIDDHCKQSLFTMLKDEQRIIFKQINKKNSEFLSFSKLEG